MRYVPREPDTSVNVSKEHPLVEATTLIVGLGILFAAAVVLLVIFVEIVLYFVPAEHEARMFQTWLPDDLEAVERDDERLLETEALLQRLSEHYSESPYPFRVEINDSPVVNAMAFPGGLIVVTSGLLDAVESENELAFVLGHEMGHFRNRDHLRALGRGLALSLGLMALSGSGDAVGYGASIADLTLRGFSRRQEIAADAFGLELVQAEYGHVNGSWRFFERIGEPDDALSEMLVYAATHPAPDDRVESIVELASRRGWPVDGKTASLDWK